MSRLDEISNSVAQLINAGFAVTIMHAPKPDGGCTCGRTDCKNPGKHPREAGWTRAPYVDVKSAERALARSPQSNIAVVTGDGIIALDVDTRHGGDQSLIDLQKRHGELPISATVATGGGGRHLYFRAEIGTRSRVLAPGLELKAAGACLVAPPSLHISGKTYRWLVPFTSVNELPRAPDWLLRSAVSASRATGKLDSKGFVEGERNVGLTRYAGCLIGKNVPLRLVTSLLVAFDAQFNLPPLGVNEVHTIVTSIATRELRKRGA